MQDEVHRHVRELLGWYGLDRLDGVERSVVEGHVEMCPHCQDQLVEHVVERTPPDAFLARGPSQCSSVDDLIPRPRRPSA